MKVGAIKKFQSNVDAFRVPKNLLGFKLHFARLADLTLEKSLEKLFCQTSTSTLLFFSKSIDIDILYSD